MIVLYSILDSTAKGILVFTIFHILHPHITIHSVERFLHLYIVVFRRRWCSVQLEVGWWVWSVKR